MRQTLFIIFSLLTTSCFSQNLQDSLAKHYVADTSKPLLYCGSGLETLVYSKADKSFEKQYNVKYDIVGCVQIYFVEVMSFHNKAIAQFLDRKYGLSWRNKLRSDVFGISK